MNFSVSEIITSDFCSQAATAGLFSTGSIVALNYVKRMRRIFKVSFYIRGNHVNKDDTCAVMIRLSLDGERISAGTTGISIKPELWDGQRQQLKGRSTEVLQTNKKLGGIRDELLAIAEKLEFEGSLALDRVKAVFLGVDEDYDTIGKLFDKYIKNVKEQVDVCLSKTFLSKYELCRRRFMQMLEKKYHCKDMSLKELNPVVVQDYKNFLMTDVNMCNNTAVKTMKTFRTVILYGIKLGVIHKDPFVGVHFHMNSVVRQLLEQNTDVVMVDTGDSYEGICRYFKGTYITYSKEKPISMNPFKITDTEYTQNFGEKKNFLKSLIFLIFKGSEAPTKIEDKIINQTIVEYYESYFTPFKEFTDAERDQLRIRLLLEDKKNGTYERHSKELEEKYKHTEYEYETDIPTSETSEDPSAFGGQDNEYGSLHPADGSRMADDGPLHTAEEKEAYARIQRKVNKLHDLINDKAATDGEKVAANRQLMRLMPQLIEGNYLVTIEQRIDRMEKQRQKMHVDNLSFNSYYEFAIERIPQIMREKSITFDIDNFAAILEQFYKGGELEHTLNNDVDASLFDEKFIVFEIDKIKDDPVLFPIVVLIIMDVFLQKMRIKKGRKALIIEEAWKAISSPTMAEYIKYLYKTVRKFHGIAGVVTQELNDVIDSPIVKEAIINNSDVKILLDQSKFKDRYDAISAILGLTQVQKQQIFTVNALNNHEGRNYFKEVWICRGQYFDVYGVEEPPECYWAYTTERAEKEALKVYERHYGDIQTAITKIEEDRKKLGIKKYLDFAVKVNKQQKIMPLWDKSD